MGGGGDGDGILAEKIRKRGMIVCDLVWDLDLVHKLT